MYWNTHSYYSLRYGTLPVERLVGMGHNLGLRRMGLTDINNTTGTIDFVKACKEKGITPMAGIGFFSNNHLLYTGLAMNNEGFRELNEFLSKHNLEKSPLPSHPPDFPNAFVIYPYGSKDAKTLKENEYISIGLQDIRRLPFSKYRYHQDKLVLQHPVVHAGGEDFILHQNLRAISRNILISKLSPEDVAAENACFLSPSLLLEKLRDFPDIIDNTRRMTEACSIDFDFQSVKNKQTFTRSVYDDKCLLEKLAFDGLEYRYGNNNSLARNRLISELGIISRLGFAAYFLITWDIVRYSMSRGFYHVGRGSGANSIVAYCLKITNVDPIELNLYFERFINPKRSNPPDFDIDYSWTERDEVQDYIFKRYGRRHTALLGATSTFKGRSIYRELGKVYGLPKNEIDLLVSHPGSKFNNNDVVRQIHSLAGRMTDFPNIRSIHAGGVLISEDPITCYTALDLPPKGFPTTQWDMYVAEDIGFEKLDILSQRGIGHIRDCTGIILENKSVKIDVHKVSSFKEDPKVRSMLKSGETNGCFYIESPAMRGLLKKLKCDNYLSLVAASSIIRPGVARSGMMREYIRRFHDPEGFQYLHPVMEEQLRETYGVMVYQEDVLKVCHHFAGLDLADSDVLRRAMSGKFRGRKEFQRIVDRFFSNCRERGYDEKVTREVWRQIESFAGYSFSKAHSASYAVESYQSLFLKAHYPREFMVAVINNFGGFYHSWVYFNEARRWGARIMLPCVNNSRFKTCIKGNNIFIGFVHVQNLENKVSHTIQKERGLGGEFLSLENFLSRIPAGIEQTVILIRSGAFRFSGKSKAHLLWEAHLLIGKKNKNSGGCTLFHSRTRGFKLPQMKSSKIEDAYDEIEFLGFPVTLTYFDLLESKPDRYLPAASLEQSIGKYIEVHGLLVTIKYVRTVKKEIMHFAAFLDHHGEFFDTVHFPDSLKKCPFRGNGVYRISGKVVEEFGFPSIEVHAMAKMPLIKDPRG